MPAAKMNHWERVTAAIAGEAVDHVPVSLWHHFPEIDLDPAKLAESTIELPVQVNGKVRDRIIVDANADDQTVLAAAEASEKLAPWIAGKTIRKKLYVPRKLVNFVVG